MAEWTPYLCPVCDGGGGPDCICDRAGLVTFAEALEWARMSAEDGRLEIPLPLAPLPEAALPPPANVMPARCHDCAFRPDSPEREDSFGKWLAMQESFYEGGRFWCHQGMHATPEGKYRPFAEGDGELEGHPLCAGYMQQVRREQRRRSA